VRDVAGLWMSVVARLRDEPRLAARP